MNFEKDQIVTLDNKKDYFVFEKKIYKDALYSLLVNINEDEDIMFVSEVEENGEKFIEEVTDEKLKNELSTYFEKEIDKELELN